jgi:hypothetical protein
MSTDGITKRVLEFVKQKNEITAPEIAAFIIKLAREDLGLDADSYNAAGIGKSVLWRGATSYAKDIIKRPRVVEEILAEDDDEAGTDDRQGELFAGLDAFVRVGLRDGAWCFKRRRALYQDEYHAAMALLREKYRQVGARLERYQLDYETAQPFWAAGLTFGEAVEAASQQG